MSTDNSTTQPLSRLQRVKAGAIQAFPTQQEHRMLNIDRLVENPDNERRTFRNMDGLIATVRSSGIIEPLIVEPANDGRYLVKIGVRRLRAAKAVGLAKVPVIITEPDQGAARRRKSIISNLQREDIGPIEMAEGLQALLDEDETITTQRELASAIGKREAWVSDLLRVLTLPAHLQEKLRLTEVSVPHDAVMRIARVKGENHQKRLVSAVLDGATQREVRQQIDALKGRSEAPARKPKAVYETSVGATVIVQSLSETLTREQEIAALREAWKQARNRR